MERTRLHNREPEQGATKIPSIYGHGNIFKVMAGALVQSWRPTLTHRNLRCTGTVTSAMSGPVRVVNGLQNSRKVHAFSYRRRSNSVVRWLVRSRRWSLWHTGRYRHPGRPCHSLGIGLHGRSPECIGNIWSVRIIQVHAPIRGWDLYRKWYGGVTSMAQMFKDRRDEKQVQNDILQET